MFFSDFEDLFNRFNNQKNNNKNDFQEFINKLKQSINNSNDDLLGEPDSIERFTDNGFVFEKRIWENEHGRVIKVEMVNTPFEKPIIKERVDELPLEIQLKRAIDEERYEDAAQIRDKMKNIENETLEQIVNNQEVNETDEWNF
jgi:excinuclease UvrABC helicase subunit UvrB